MSAVAVAAAVVLVATTGTAKAHACGASDYSYAGLLGQQPGYGVAATIESLSAPTLRGGHVAAWVGVGGPGLGPRGTDEWLQAGISADGREGFALYYELALPHRAPKYVRLKGHVPSHQAYRLSVREDARRPNEWRVFVDRVPVTASIRLPGSHGTWSPIATTESWNGRVGACNGFAFRFENVVSVLRPGSAWSSMPSRVIVAPGYSVSRRGPAAFDAAGHV